VHKVETMEQFIAQTIEHFRHHYHVEVFGFAAAAATLYATYVRTIIPLRVAAIVANALAAIYSFSHGTYPTFLLNVILLPLNVVRLRSMAHLVREVDAATNDDLNVEWLRPYMRPQNFRAGEYLMRRGDIATEAFYIVSGEVELVEIQKTCGPGTLLGEMGLFTPGNQRTQSVRCKTDVHTARITYEQFKQLYFQNPQFGFAVLRLIVARLYDNAELARQVKPS
jgi:CRP/FNR family transcriptional regulator, cyclic AMP receptor protein